MQKLVRWFVAKINQINLANKLIAFNVVLCILPIVVISLAVNKQLESRIHAEQQLIYERELDRYVLNLEAKLSNYVSHVGRLAADQFVCDTLNGMEHLSADQAYLQGERISVYITRLMGEASGTEWQDIILYSFDRQHPVYSSRLVTIEQAENDNWYAMYSQREPGQEVFSYSPGPHASNRLCFIKTIASKQNSPAEALGLVRLDLAADRFFMNPWAFDNRAYSLHVVDNARNKVVYAENPSYYPLEEQPGIAALKDNDEHTDVTDNLFLMKRTLKRVDLDVYLFADNKLALQKTDEARLLLITTGALLTLLSILLSVLFSKIFNRRMQRLMNKMAIVESGSFEISAPMEGNDEIAQLDHCFNNMVLRLKKQIEENYIQSHLTREAEYNALKFQINPHFLFNILETINAMAAVYEADEIAQISQHLGEMLHYSLGTDMRKEGVLLQELNHIKNYIAIQKIRFEDQFDVVIDVPSRLESASVLYFVIQPVVENALKHGLGKSDHQCRIHIRAGTDGAQQMLVLEVSDNGPGIPPDVLSRMNACFSAAEWDNLLEFTKESGIGLQNVNRRIRLHYGEQYGLRVSNIESGGARVIMTFPLGRQGAKGDSDG